MSVATLASKLFRWNGPALLSRINKATEQGLDRAAVMVVNDVVGHFGSPPPEPNKSGGFKKNSSKKWKRAHPSAPGDPPNIQTGQLKRSIKFDKPAPLRRRVGSMLKPQGSGRSYAHVLEYGGKYVEARPFLRPAVARNKDLIAKTIIASIRGGAFK